MLRRSQNREAPGPKIAREFDDPRLELVRLLNEACQVEHALLLQYLYAAYSVRRPAYDGLVGRVDGSTTTLLGIAAQEMAHLRDVNRVLVELGAAPNFTHQDFPFEPGIYPFAMKLERLSRVSVAKYLFAEAPVGALDSDSDSAEPADFIEKVCEALGAGPRLSHIGSLYATILDLFQELDAAESEPRCAPWADTIRAIKSEGETDHYEFFRAVFLGKHDAFAQLGETVWADPDRDTYPSVPLPDDPSVHATRDGDLAPSGRELAHLANHAYWGILLLLDLSNRAGGARGRALAQGAVALMTDALEPVAEALAMQCVGVPFDRLTTGYSPGLDLAENLRFADRILHQAELLLGAVGDGLEAGQSNRVARTLGSTRRSLAELAESVARQAPVLIAGAGPAGLAAAAALVSRHVPVRLVDHAPVLGGKAYSERDAAGRSQEHGVHGWWPGYRNFDRILEEAGVDLAAALRSSSGGAIRMDDGRLAPLQELGSSLPSPLFLLFHFLRAPFLRWWDALRTLPFAVHAIAFRHEADYEQYDSLTLEELTIRLHVPESVRKYLLRPFATAFDYAPADVVSASSILSALQFYLLPSARALLPRWSRGLPEETIFAPLAESIEARGGRIEVASPLESVLIEGGAVTGAVVAQAGGAVERGSEVVASFRLDGLGESRFVSDPSESVWIGRHGEEICAFSATCPHASGPVEWREDEQQFVCRRHGGSFAADGSRSSGPPRRPLVELATQRRGTAVDVLGRHRRSLLRVPDVIIATEVPEAERILAASDGVPETLLARLEALGTTPVVVVRLWFEPGVRVPEPETVLLPNPEIADVYFHLNAFDPSYDPEGTVIEVHGCDPEGRWTRESEESILAAALRDLSLLSDDLTHAKLKRGTGREAGMLYRVQKHSSSFTLFAPGKARLRPDAATGVAGLYLAGDWTRVDWSVWMMERAVVAGLRAANRVLGARGLQPVAILPPPSEGRLLRLSRGVARVFRRLWPLAAR